MDVFLSKEWPSKENGALIGWEWAFEAVYAQGLDYAHVAKEICACKIKETFCRPMKMRRMAVEMQNYGLMQRWV